MANLRK